MSSPREREKRDRRDSRDEREGQGRKRKMKVKTQKKLNNPPTPIHAERTAGLAQL